MLSLTGGNRFLTRLLLVHGRYAAHRTAFVAQYSFYKSLFICFIQLVYAFYTGFSGSPYFNSFALTTYNVIFTGVPIMGYIFDKDLPEALLLSEPGRYATPQRGRFFNLGTFAWWLLRAVYQAFVVIFFTSGIFGNSWLRFDGATEDWDSSGMVAFTVAVGVQVFTLFLGHNSLTLLNHLLVWGMAVVYVVSVAFFNWFVLFGFYFVIFRLYADPAFWLAVLLMLVTALLPVFAWRAWVRDPGRHMARDASLEEIVGPALDLPPEPELRRRQIAN